MLRVTFVVDYVRRRRRHRRIEKVRARLASARRVAAWRGTGVLDPLVVSLEAELDRLVSEEARRARR